MSLVKLDSASVPQQLIISSVLRVLMAMSLWSLYSFFTKQAGLAEVAGTNAPALIRCKEMGNQYHWTRLGSFKTVREKLSLVLLL